MKTRKYLSLVILLVLCNSALALEINEVMYNPSSEQGGNSYSEWVEIYNNGDDDIDLTGWKICNDELLSGYVNNSDKIVHLNNGLVVSKNSYALITDGGSGTKTYDFFKVDNRSLALCTDASSICGGLSNTPGEELIVKNKENNLIFNVTYNTLLGGDDGKTLCLFNNTWQECIPTPGSVNVGLENDENLETINKNIVLSTQLEDAIYTGSKYTKLFGIKIDNKESCSEKDIITIFYNITNNGGVKENIFTKEVGCSSTASTGELFLEEPGDYTLCGKTINSTIDETDLTDNFVCMDFEVVDPYSVSCDISLETNTEQTIFYDKGDSIKFKHVLSNDSFPYAIEYWVEDLFGNIIKNKFNTTNTNQKSWKTSIDEEDRVLFLKSIIHPSCNDFNLSNNLDEKMFIVVSNEFSIASEESSSGKNSQINITKITPQEISFGGLLKADIGIYKNSTNKYSISAWVEKDGDVVSEKTKINLKNKDTEYKVTLPIQLDANCNKKISDGEASIVVEGLGEEAKEKIIVAGINSKLCETSGQASAAKTDSKLSYGVEVPSTINSGEKFPVKVKFTNEDKEHNFEVWAYLYRGSKCYSCSEGEREGNLESFTVKENQEKEVKLSVPADRNLEEGEYMLKIKIRKDNQKTTKDFTEIIKVEDQLKEAASHQEDSLTYLSEPSKTDPSDAEKERIVHKGKGIIIYESSSEKAKKLIPSFLAVTFGLLSLLFVFRKK